jgi:hypothetical protein
MDWMFVGVTVGVIIYFGILGLVLKADELKARLDNDN